MDKEKKALQATEILENPLFAEVFHKLDGQTVASWRLAATPDERERLHLRQRVLHDLKRDFLSHIETMARMEKENKGPSRFSAVCAKVKEIFK